MSNKLDITSLFLQALSLQILFQDYNNRDLMQELQTQDEKYFKTIIKQNQQIIDLLRKEDTNAREVRKEN